MSLSKKFKRSSEGLCEGCGKVYKNCVCRRFSKRKRKYIPQVLASRKGIVRPPHMVYSARRIEVVCLQHDCKKYPPAVIARRKTGRKAEKILAEAIKHVLDKVEKGVYSIADWPPEVREAADILVLAKNKVISKEVNAKMTRDDEKFLEVTNRLDKKQVV